MIADDLTRGDLTLIVESLAFTEQRFREYTGYPSFEFKQERLAEVHAVQAKVRTLRDRMA